MVGREQTCAVLIKLIKNLSNLKTSDLVEMELGYDENDHDIILYASETIKEILDFSLDHWQRFVEEAKNENAKFEPLAPDEVLPLLLSDLKLSVFDELNDSSILKAIQHANVLGNLISFVPQSPCLALINLAAALEQKQEEKLSEEDEKKELTNKCKDAVDQIEKQIKDRETRIQPLFVLEEKLLTECNQYLEYLVKTILKEAKIELTQYELPAKVIKKNPNGEIQFLFDDTFNKFINEKNKNPELQLALEKYKVMKNLYSDLESLDRPVEKRILRFKETFNKVRKTLETRRDSAGMKFLKVIATIFSLLWAYPRLWYVAGREASQRIDLLLINAKPKFKP